MDLAAYIITKRSLKIGEWAPDFTQPDINGKPFSMSAVKGNYIFIDFWASWCVPCRAQNPALKKIYEQYKDKNFKILAVSLDDNRNYWLEAIKEDKLVWQQVSDLKGWQNEAARRYNIQSVPANYLIGPDGKILSINEDLKQLSERLSLLIK